MEYSYDDASSGQIVFSPYAFDSSYSSGRLNRIEFAHGASIREMTVFSQHAPSLNTVTASIGLAREQSGYVDLYFSAHLDTDHGGDAINDAYLFGARIEEASPHLCTAKQGICDQDDPYSFTLYGAANPVNNGHFDESGFVADGQSSDGGYPAASSVDPANLPTSSAVSAVSVSFQSTADPDFI
jgi:hypothetical protein